MPNTWNYWEKADIAKENLIHNFKREKWKVASRFEKEWKLYRRLAKGSTHNGMKRTK